MDLVFLVLLVVQKNLLGPVKFQKNKINMIKICVKWGFFSPTIVIQDGYSLVDLLCLLHLEVLFLLVVPVNQQKDLSINNTSICYLSKIQLFRWRISMIVTGIPWPPLSPAGPGSPGAPWVENTRRSCFKKKISKDLHQERVLLIE